MAGPPVDDRSRSSGDVSASSFEDADFDDDEENTDLGDGESSFYDEEEITTQTSRGGETRSRSSRGGVTKSRSSRGGESSAHEDESAIRNEDSRSRSTGASHEDESTFRDEDSKSRTTGFEEESYYSDEDSKSRGDSVPQASRSRGGDSASRGGSSKRSSFRSAGSKSRGGDSRSRSGSSKVPVEKSSSFSSKGSNKSSGGDSRSRSGSSKVPIEKSSSFGSKGSTKSSGGDSASRGAGASPKSPGEHPLEENSSFGSKGSTKSSGGDSASRGAGASPKFPGEHSSSRGERNSFRDETSKPKGGDAISKADGSMSLLEIDEPKFDGEHNSFLDKSSRTGANTIREEAIREEARTTVKKSRKKAVDFTADDKSIPRRVVKGCKSIAVLGTMSDAGKSVVSAGLCRILSNGGMRVAPFKGQNMSNNASPALLPDHSRREKLYKSLQKAVGPEMKLPTSPNSSVDQGYGEIGTAQSLQAEACRLVPRVEMNPVLLKSGGRNKNGEHLCSVVVLGKQIVRETFGDLGKRTTSLRTMVLDSHEALAEATGAEVIVLEGAGSCTELNFRHRDIMNLPLVRALNCPWILVANIDPGGVFAQIVGTKMCVSEHDWSLCVGVIVNQLKGEAKYFDPGPKMIEDMVGKPVFVVPFLYNLNLPEEDGLGIERRLAGESSEGQRAKSTSESDAEEKPVVVVIAYPHTAMSDDLCPLEADPRFKVEWRRRSIPRPYPHTSAVILPGSRLTRLDLKWLHDSGWGDFIRKHVAAGGSVLGICGGYQMLGWSVEDPSEAEGAIGSKQGLGLLPISTTIKPAECKVIAPRKGALYPSKIQVEGFELHCGQSRILAQVSGGHQIKPFLFFEDGLPEGMSSDRVKGTYLHGVLRSPEARVELLVPHIDKFPLLKKLEAQDPLDRFAKHLESCGLNFDTVKGMIDKHSNS